MFPTVNRVYQQLQAWLNYPRRQAALIRKIVDRIRNSLELPVVLKTAVDEVAKLLGLDYCSFLWYFHDTQRIQVVCERHADIRKPSYLGYHQLEKFGGIVPALVTGQLTINHGTINSPSTDLNSIWQQLSWLLSSSKQRDRNKNQPQQYPAENQQIFGYEASLLIPVTSNESGIGFIACFCEKPRCWSASQIEFLESIAEPLEIAIRQAQLYEQTQKQALRERLVNHIINRTRQSFNTQIILTEVAQELLEALQIDRCFVHLVEDLNNQETLELNSESALNVKNENLWRRKHLYEVCRPPFAPAIADFDTDGPITQWVIQHQKLVVISDITQDERIGKTNLEYQNAQIKSSLVVPVQTNNILHALLYLNQCSQIRYWSKLYRINWQFLCNKLIYMTALSSKQPRVIDKRRKWLKC